MRTAVPSRRTAQGEGLGSEFVVRLPLPPRTSRRRQRRLGATIARESQRVLVVDDNHDVSASYALLLRGMGHSAHVARSGEEAIAQIRDFQPRLVLMDLAMPGMSGIEAARRLRPHYPSTQLTLVAVTGYTDPDIEQFARDAGFDRVLTKPLAMHTLRLADRVAACRKPLAAASVRGGRGLRKPAARHVVCRSHRRCRESRTLPDKSEYAKASPMGNATSHPAPACSLPGQA